MRRGYRVWVGKQGDKEIDFVVQSKSDATEYYQVAYSTKSSDVYEREIAPLRSLSDSHPKYIITMDLETLDDHGIKQIYAVDWLLQSERSDHVH